jgi:hypothetical protein
VFRSISIHGDWQFCSGALFHDSAIRASPTCRFSGPLFLVGAMLRDTEN